MIGNERSALFCLADRQITTVKNKFLLKIYREFRLSIYKFMLTPQYAGVGSMEDYI